MAGTGEPARIQDPYCLRTLPQVLGAVSEELASLELLLERLVVAGHENPLVFGSEADGSNGVAHHGLFQMTTLARRVDALHLALGTACATNLRRIDLLCDPAFTGLNRFLAADDAGQSGVMMLEYVAAAAAGLMRANAQPVSLQTVVLSLGAEEDASFASVATSRLDSTVQALATMTAVELGVFSAGTADAGTDTVRVQQSTAQENPRNRIHAAGRQPGPRPPPRRR